MAELISAKRLSFCEDRYPISDPLTVICRLFTGWFCRDRFDWLNHYSPFKVMSGIDPQTQLFLKTKDDPVDDVKLLCDKKAAELINTGKPLYVSWSGGVDSTSVVVSLMKAGIPKDQLKIICAESSKTEYPYLYNKLHEDGYEFIETRKVVEAYNDIKDGLIITGWCADQLFGSNIHLRNRTWYHTPWVDGLKLAMVDRGIRLSDRSYDALHDVYEGYANNIGLSLTQFCEFAWLVNFGIKWSYVQDETKLSMNSQSGRDRVVNFFEDVEFQRWSYQNFSKLSSANPHITFKLYKRPLKEYIFDYLNEESYFVKKNKMNSWALVVDFAHESTHVRDTEGWKQFTLKSNFISRCSLNAAVAQKYLKEDYLD